jgi:serine/threonine protein kinase/tetratricopeptide (TPR) repeat protein
MVGQTISHYKIVEKLGQGGMGVVYKAEDLSLDRLVALKFLAHHLVSDEDSHKRFIREAKTAAALLHPNICTVHEIDNAEGHTFIAMAYLEGDELSKRIAQGPLSIDQLLDVAMQVARGLQEAHGKGVVHRDIKPANIMLTAAGQAVLMDFGLAQVTAAASKLTREGISVGTTAYMSPEQTTGESIDHRTDIWALGVVLYEMATGQVPFQGHYANAILYSILNENPTSITALRTGIPLELERIVSKCMAKRPDERYQTASDLLADLSTLKRILESGAERRSPSGITDTRPSIAVLPFENRGRGDEDEYFSDGISEDITSALVKLQRLRVAPRSAAFQFKGKRPTPEEAGRKLNVRYLLEGSLRRSGNRVRINVELIAIDEGYEVWSERYDRVMDDIFEIQDEISQAIVENLQLKLVAGDQKPLIKHYTANVDAYNHYLKGRYYWYKRTPDAFQQAIGHFERVIAEDAGFAPAYVGLADCHAVLAWYGGVTVAEATAKAESLARKALEIDPELGEAHATLAFIKGTFEWNWTESERGFQRALQLNPNYAIGRFWYAHFCLAPTGRLDEAFAELRKGLEAEPLLANMHGVMGILWTFRRNYAEAVKAFQIALELNPNFPLALGYLGETYCHQGNYEQAVELIRKAASMSPPGARWGTGLLAYCFGRWGKREEAERVLNELQCLSVQTYVPAYSFAMAYIGIGDFDLAFESLNRACEERTGAMCWLHLEPLYEPIRHDPRFNALARRIGLPGLHSR